MGLKERVADRYKCLQRYVVVHDVSATHPSIGIVVGVLLLGAALEYQAGNAILAATHGLLAAAGIWYQVWWMRFVTQWRIAHEAEMRQVRRELREYKYDPEELDE